MYQLKVPYKDLYNKPGNTVVFFNLFEREVFRLLPELQFIMGWIEKQEGEEIRDIPTEEVVRFYTAFEELILESYGVPSADGLQFDKSGTYDFKDSVIFNAVMIMMVEDPKRVAEMLDGLMPKDLQELAKRADSNLSELAKKEDNPEKLREEIDRLRAQLTVEPQSAQDQSPQSSEN